MPAEGHLLDIDAGHGVDALAHPLAAQALVEEARGIVGQHPQHGGVAAVGAQLAEQRVEQAAAEPAVLEVGLNVERIDLADADLAAAQAFRRIAHRAAAAEAHDAHVAVVRHEHAPRLAGVLQELRPPGRLAHIRHGDQHRVG